VAEILQQILRMTSMGDGIEGGGFPQFSVRDSQFHDTKWDGWGRKLKDLSCFNRLAEDPVFAIVMTG